MKKITVASFSVIICLLTFLAFKADNDLFQISKNLDIFASVYKELNISYVDDINTSKLMRTGVDAMLEDLDPYTEFVPESEIEDYKMKYVSTQYGGIGATIFNRSGKVYISETFENFPAQKGDVKAGDQLIEINGSAVKDKSNEQISQFLKGPKGSEVKLILVRDGKTIEKSLIREEIKQPNVTYSGIINNDIGYIKLDKFLENAAQEVKDAMVEIKKSNPKGIVLDLRYNGGGILQEAVKIVNLFVDKDVQVVTQKGKSKDRTIVYKTFNTAVDTEIPLTVLVNSRSASASEIVAGSLQDLDRAVIIGQRSFGKGLVQQTFNLPYNSLVKVTVAKYYTPSGRCIQALDYTHRNLDGSVEKVSDSLITEYKTKGGRLVYDGSGIYPDVAIKPMRFNQITQTLVTKYLIFDYATKFQKEHAKLSPAKNFKLTDQEYEAFVSYLSGKDYSYSTTTEKILTELKEEAQKENKFTEVKPEYESLKAKVSQSKKNDLIQFKPEIKQVLESEIVARYYFERGRAEHLFQYDKEFAEAEQIMKNKTNLLAILKGDGTYKTIGKPVSVTSAQIK